MPDLTTCRKKGGNENGLLNSLIHKLLNTFFFVYLFETVTIVFCAVFPPDL